MHLGIAFLGSSFCFLASLLHAFSLTCTQQRWLFQRTVMMNLPMKRSGLSINVYNYLHVQLCIIVIISRLEQEWFLHSLLNECYNNLLLFACYFNWLSRWFLFYAITAMLMDSKQYWSVTGSCCSPSDQYYFVCFTIVISVSRDCLQTTYSS